MKINQKTAVAMVGKVANSLSQADIDTLNKQLKGIKDKETATEIIWDRAVEVSNPYK